MTETHVLYVHANDPVYKEKPTYSLRMIGDRDELRRVQERERLRLKDRPAAMTSLLRWSC